MVTGSAWISHSGDSGGKCPAIYPYGWDERKDSVGGVCNYYWD